MPKEHSKIFLQASEKHIILILSSKMAQLQFSENGSKLMKFSKSLLAIQKILNIFTCLDVMELESRLLFNKLHVCVFREVSLRVVCILWMERKFKRSINQIFRPISSKNQKLEPFLTFRHSTNTQIRTFY